MSPSLMSFLMDLINVWPGEGPDPPQCSLWGQQLGDRVAMSGPLSHRAQHRPLSHGQVRFRPG